MLDRSFQDHQSDACRGWHSPTANFSPYRVLLSSRTDLGQCLGTVRRADLAIPKPHIQTSHPLPFYLPFYGRPLLFLGNFANLLILIAIGIFKLQMRANIVK